MANINLTKQHKPLIQAAIKLGDWLLSLPEIKGEDAEVIKSIQQALAKLPKLNDGTLAMYGFSIERGDDLAGLVRGWDVSLEYFASDLERQGGLELFSSYIPIPETTDKSVLALKKQNEVYFNWPVGDTCSLIPPQQQQQWIAEVSNPATYLQQGDRLRIEAVFANDYVEVDCLSMPS